MWALRAGWKRLKHAYRSPFSFCQIKTYCSSDGNLKVSRDVADALATGKPVVALETTLLTHGMPYPDNINIAKEMEEIVRKNNVLPATIGVLKGKIYVGMSGDQLDELADMTRAGRTLKISRRDLAYAVSEGLSGGTTVAATMICAERAGIPIFITGGLGGVHRGGESSMDVSADIMELGRTPVAVVCAGIKSILDIGRTLEVLETQGVAVATLGESPDFPAFFTHSSGHKAPITVESVAAAARLIDTSLYGLKVRSGVVIAAPLPVEASADGAMVESAIQEALVLAESEGVRGKEVTPFVLGKVKDLTHGQSLKAKRSSKQHSNAEPKKISVGRKKFGLESNKNETPVVIGASIFDFVVKVTSPEIKPEGTNPGTMHQSFGGVARNITECMSRAGTLPFFISALGDDESGRRIGCGLKEVGVSLDGVLMSATDPTASYCVLLNSEGEVTCGVGDMTIHSLITPEWVARYQDRLSTAPIVIADGNIPLETLVYICDICDKNGVPVWFEPTGPDKARALTQDGVLGKITYTSPNLSELRSIRNSLLNLESIDSTPLTDMTVEDKLWECSSLVPILLNHVPHVLASLGRDGVVWGHRGDGGGRGERLCHFSTLGYPDHNQPINVSGAGDSFVGAMVASLVQGLSYELAIKAGLRAANLSVRSMTCISPAVKPHLFSETALLDWAPWQPQELNSQTIT